MVQSKKVTSRGEVSLSRLINQPLRIEERHSSNPGYLHVSSLFTLCMRKVFLLQQSGEQDFRTVPFGTAIRFDMGEAVEDKMRRRLLAIGVINGDQPQFVNEEFKIVGHADGRLKNGRLLEIKGKDPALFKITQRYPLRRDQFQLETYLWLDNTTEGTLLTFTWGQASVPVHDQLVRYNLKTVDIIKRTVSPLREAEAGGSLPTRICATQQDPRAVACVMRGLCFQEPTGGISKTIEDQIKERGTNAGGV